MKIKHTLITYFSFIVILFSFPSYAFTQCGDTWQPQKPSIDESKTKCPGAGMTPIDYNVKHFWRIFWADGDRRNGEATGTGQCRLPTLLHAMLRVRQKCPPKFNDPGWIVNTSASATFLHLAEIGEFIENSEGELVCLDTTSRIPVTKRNAHRHVCQYPAARSGVLGGPICDDPELAFTSNPSPETECTGSPIVIDTLGNGIKLTRPARGVRFDLSGNNKKRKWAWTKKGTDDAWLVLDRNKNGRIDNGKELFGNYTDQPKKIPFNQRHGFHALAVFDLRNNGGNQDGKINPRDRIYNDLRLWQDKNHNGISEPGELSTLKKLGVRAIRLNFKTSRKEDRHGNQFRYRARVNDRRNFTLGKWAWDVFLISHK